MIRLLTIFAVVGLAQSAPAQELDTVWTKAFGGGLSEHASTIQETADGGFIIGGRTFSFANGASDAWLVRTDASGDTLWTRTYGEDVSVHENAQSVVLTSDGGFVATGTVNAAFTDALLIRTDSQGDTLWTRTYGGFDTDQGHDVVQTVDGGFVICGTTRSYHLGFGSSVWLVRTDAQGDSLWSKTYGGSSYQVGSAISLTSDDGYIVTGSYNNGGSQSADVWLLRTDADGDTLWTRTYGGEGTQQGASVLQTSDGGYALTAFTFGASGSEIWLIRTDENGETLWMEIFEGTIEGAGSLAETSDGGFILTGGTSDGDVLVLRTDGHGNQLWTGSFGGDEFDHGNSVQQTADGGFVVAGMTDSYGAGQSDAWVIRLRSETTTSNSQSLLSHPVGFRLHQNYPNPFNPNTTITYSVERPSAVRLTIFNILGREVTLVNAVQSAGEYSIAWDGRDEAGGYVSSGSYLYRMQVGHLVQTRSMLFIK